MSTIELELTERQRDCLRLVAAGLNRKEIGKVMFLDPSTVTLHVRGARHRLGARNTEHAVAIACVRGIITARHLKAGERVSDVHQV